MGRIVVESFFFLSGIHCWKSHVAAHLFLLDNKQKVFFHYALLSEGCYNNNSIKISI